MAWFRLEGRGAFHHKVLAAGDEAYGAWVRAGQWSSDQLTDGFVPRATALNINRKPKVWAKLVEARLLEEADGGYRIHDFLDWNPSSEGERARREEMREKRREAGRAGGIRSGASRRGEGAKPNDSEDFPKQDGSNGEANAKQSASDDAKQNASFASGLLEAKAKQNEAPSPSPSPSPIVSPPLTGARAHVATPTSMTEAPPSSGLGAPIADAQTLLAAVTRHPMLATLHGDTRWALNASSGFMGGVVRAADVDAAINAFVTREASRAPDFDDALDRFVRDRIGGYLTKARQYGDEARARARREAERDQRGRPAPPHSPDAQAALEVFGTVWATKKRRSFVPAAGDDRHAADLAERARAAAPLGTWLDVVRFWAERHLASQDRFVVDSDHALRTLGSQLTSYGLPKTPAAKQSLRLHEEPVVGAPMPAGMLDAIGAQGPREGAVMRRPGGPS